MAHRTLVVLVDDLDGETLAGNGGQAVNFGLDGQAYEIDLSDENAADLRRAVQPYIDAGRRVSRGSSGQQSRRNLRGSGDGGSTGRGHDTAKIREWARAHGHQISDRGRLPGEGVGGLRAALTPPSRVTGEPTEPHGGVSAC